MYLQLWLTRVKRGEKGTERNEQLTGEKGGLRCKHHRASNAEQPGNELSETRRIAGDRRRAKRQACGVKVVLGENERRTADVRNGRAEMQTPPDNER
jgi:hypothetical protein